MNRLQLVRRKHRFCLEGPGLSLPSPYHPHPLYHQLSACL